MKNASVRAAAKPICPNPFRCRTSSTPFAVSWDNRPMTARILVVDDIEANIRLLEAKLSAEYYDVITASDGPTALALAAGEHPDIVLLDRMMPGMDGVE